MRKHPLAECESCPLADDGKFVPSLIPLLPKLAVVGEAPGQYEAAYKEPFRGPSGKLLDQVLGHNGLSRSQVMYTNACLCRPEDNATPPKAAIHACRGRLMAELAASGVEDVVALGGTAASVLLDDIRGITRLRVGPPKKPTSALKNSSVRRILPTWHPAYCLRNADAFPSMVSDIAKLKAGVTSAWTPPEWQYFEDGGMAIEAMGEIEKLSNDIYVDIECGIEKDVSFGHPNEYDLLCVGLGYAERRVVVIGYSALRERRVLDSLGALLKRSSIEAHNGKFDLGGLYPHLGPLQLGFDTMLGSYVLDERPGNHSLEVLSVEKLGAPNWKAEFKKHIPPGGNYGDVPRPILYQYNAWDVSNGWALKKYEQELFDDDQRRLLRFLCAASDQLMYLELNGITVDRQYSNELVHTFLVRINPLEARIDEIVKTSTSNLEGVQQLTFLNPRSPKQIREYLASQQVYVQKTDVNTLKPLLGGTLRRLSNQAPAEFVRTLLEHRRQQKLYSTYVTGIRKRMYKGRVFTTYLLHGTTSGRLSSRNPNMQNIVRDKAIKRQFVVSKPENCLVHCDYSQAEARVIAPLAQDEHLRSLLSDHTRDIFDELCDQIFSTGNWGKEERVRIKALFYGSAYGRTPYSVAQEYSMSVQDATHMYDELMGRFPGVVRWQNEIKRAVNNGEDLKTSFGRTRRFWLITKQNQKDVENEALSFKPQSIASDICLSAFIRIRPALRGIGFVRLTIHDALIAEGPESRKEEIAEIMRSIMVEEGTKWTDYVPFVV